MSSPSFDHQISPDLPIVLVKSKGLDVDVTAPPGFYLHGSGQIRHVVEPAKRQTAAVEGATYPWDLMSWRNAVAMLMMLYQLIGLREKLQENP